MSYWRPAKLQPLRLEVAASQSWTQNLVSVLMKHRHFFSDHVCLRTIRNRVEEYLKCLVPASVEEQLFQSGLEMIKKECSEEITTPNMFVLYMFVLYRSNIKYLDVPGLRCHADRVTVLDLLYNVGAQHGHQLSTVKIKMFDQPSISIEENYLTKRVLRGFHDVTNLVIWRAADDAMLQIVGHTCRSLVSLDLWKCVKVTDKGLRMLLGLDGQNKTKICSSLEKIIIKDTSITDEGAFSLLSHCPRLHSLEFSHGTFIKQFLDKIEQNYVSHQSEFSLKSIFLPISNQQSLYNVIKSFPMLEELSLWTALNHLPKLAPSDLSRVETLKIGGLNYVSLFSDMVNTIGHQLVNLKIETVHFDINTDIIAFYCPNIEELSIINARLCITHPTEKPPFYPTTKIFSKLKKVYLFLVSYISLPDHPPSSRPPVNISDPTRVRHPVTGVTSLHSILSSATSLESVTVTGTTTLTDQCLASILQHNPLTGLKRLIISVPTSQEQLLVIPLTLLSVAALASSCPQLQCVGDLRHWAISPGHRRDIAGHHQPRDLQQSIWTKLKISSGLGPGGSGGCTKTSTVCQQTYVV